VREAPPSCVALAQAITSTAPSGSMISPRFSPFSISSSVTDPGVPTVMVTSMVFTWSVWNGVAVSPRAARQTPHVISTVLSSTM
jgi:hypothetical protein